jgi:CHAD domain-containing protein
MKRLRDLTSADSASKAARVALEQRLKKVQRKLKQLARDAEAGEPDAKRIHQLRVATRRATAALQLYRPFVPGRHRKWWKKRLRAWRRAGGEPRNCDILLASLDTQPADPELSVIRWVAMARRSRTCRELPRLARRARHAGLKRRIRKLVKAVRRKSKKKSSGKNLGRWAEKRWPEVIDRFLDAEPNSTSDAAALHCFRIRAKRLRYTLELLGSTIPAAEQELARDLVTRLQNHLGKLNDLVTMSGLLTRLFLLEPAPLSPLGGTSFVQPDAGNLTSDLLELSQASEEDVTRRARELRDAYHREWEETRQAFLVWWNDEGRTLCCILGRLGRPSSSAADCPSARASSASS